MATTRPADRADDGSDRCVPAADRTAFALGQFDDDAHESRRAGISRHLLRCPRCRADVGSISNLGSRLFSFGTGGDWETDVGAALAAERGRARVLRRAALSGIAAAAAVVTVLWVGVGTVRRPLDSDAGPVVDSTPGESPHPIPVAKALPTSASAAERATLLAAQAPDGRFVASTHVGGARHDEAATGLAILALVGEGRGIPKEPDSARAVASAVRWLRTRQGESGRFGTETRLRTRDQAIATAALLEVGFASGDAALRTSADRGVRALRQDVRDGDDDRGGWVRYALARARDLATGHASDGSPAMDDAFVAERWPTGLADGSSVIGRTLAVVDHPGRE